MRPTPNKPNEKICPHCENILAYGANFHFGVIDPQSPEIQRLWKLYKLKRFFHEFYKPKHSSKI